MGAALRYYGNLNRAQLEELQKQYPNANISSEWVNLFIKGLLKDAISGKLAEKKLTTKELLDEQKLKNARKDGALKDLTIWQKAKENNLSITLTQLEGIGNGSFQIPITNDVVKENIENQKSASTPNDKQFTQLASNVQLSIWDEAENQFICNDCNPKSKFEYRLGVITEMINIVSDYSEHILKIHNRKLTDNENKIINEYLDIVNKSIVPTNKQFDKLKQSIENHTQTSEVNKDG